MVWCVSSEIMHHKFEAHTSNIPVMPKLGTYVCCMDILLNEIMFPEGTYVCHMDILLNKIMFSEWMVEKYV